MRGAAFRELLAWTLVVTLTAVHLLRTGPPLGQTDVSAWYGHGDGQPFEPGADSAASCEALLRLLEACTMRLGVQPAEMRTMAGLLLADDSGPTKPAHARSADEPNGPVDYVASPLRLRYVGETTLHTHTHTHTHKHGRARRAFIDPHFRAHLISHVPRAHSIEIVSRTSPQLIFGHGAGWDRA
jgi:hypothetical protein